MALAVRATSSRITIRSWGMALAVILAAPCAFAGAQEDLAPKAEAPKLPGRIYIVVPRKNDVMHGLLAVDPNDRTCITVDPSVTQPARVARGGRRFAYTQPDRSAGTLKLLVADLDRDADPVQVFDRPAVFSWADDGAELIVSATRFGLAPKGPQSWRIKADGSGREKLAAPATEVIWDRSPDGQWVVTSPSRGVAEEGADPLVQTHPLYVMRVDGSDATLIAPAGGLSKTGRGGTTNAGLLVGPRLSPDGRKVAYIRTTAEIDGETRQYTRHEAKVWVVGLDGKERGVAFEGNDEDGYPYSVAWSPDAKLLALGLGRPRGASVFDGSDGRLFVVGSGGENAREIPLPHPSGIYVAEWR